jgi:hypothetical protein
VDRAEILGHRRGPLPAVRTRDWSRSLLQLWWHRRHQRRATSGSHALPVCPADPSASSCVPRPSPRSCGCVVPPSGQARQRCRPQATVPARAFRPPFVGGRCPQVASLGCRCVAAVCAAYRWGVPPLRPRLRPSGPDWAHGEVPQRRGRAVAANGRTWRGARSCLALRARAGPSGALLAGLVTSTGCGSGSRRRFGGPETAVVADWLASGPGEDAHLVDDRRGPGAQVVRGLLCGGRVAGAAEERLVE